MRIAIGANHSGSRVRAMLIELLKRAGHEVFDLGVADGSRPIDYPDIAIAVSEKVSNQEVDRGILIGGTGLGMCIVANKFRGVRAVPCHDDMTAEFSRRHCDSNVLCLSAAMLADPLIRHVVEVWLQSPFDGGRHVERLAKISRLEESDQVALKSRNSQGGTRCESQQKADEFDWWDSYLVRPYFPRSAAVPRTACPRFFAPRRASHDKTRFVAGGPILCEKHAKTYFLRDRLTARAVSGQNRFWLTGILTQGDSFMAASVDTEKCTGCGDCVESAP